MAWEQERIGDPSAPRLGGVRDAIKESVPNPEKMNLHLNLRGLGKL